MNSNGNKMLAATVVCITAMLVMEGETAAIQGSNCNTGYQTALTQLLSAKKECGNAAFADCCQAKELSTLLPFSMESAICTEITDVCNDGPFTIPNKVGARCDMESDGGGWIVIQRRVPAGGTVDFYRNWDDYEQGFGDLETEFWYGLRNIHCLTTREDVELRIDLQDESGNNQTWTYDSFTVDGPDNKYQLHVGAGVGVPAGRDSFHFQNNGFFSTKDRDNDVSSTSCAQTYRGAWWYKSCFNSNLNGPHDPITPPPQGSPTANRIMWYNGSSFIYQPFVEMKVRPKSCQVATCTP